MHHAGNRRSTEPSPQAAVQRRIRVVDLTQTLSPEFPQISLPPEIGQCWPFRIEEISRYDERGPGWYWNNFSCGEHTGTHFDAPIHWISGEDLPNNATDTIPVEHFVAPACVIDCSRGGGGGPRFSAHRRPTSKPGRPRTAASRRAPGCSCAPTGPSARTRSPTRTSTRPASTRPGPDAEAVQFLIDERDVLGFGSEAIGTDAGQAYHLRPPYPCHYFMHGAGRYGLQCLTNLDLLPPTGAVYLPRR